MSAGYLLDTDVLSDLVRAPHGRVAARIETLGEHLVCTSIVVAAELRYGAAKSGSERLARNVRLVLSAIRIEALEPPVDVHYADIGHDLARRGRPIGPNDLLIAAHARALGRTVATGNVREYQRVTGLAVENWLE